MRHDVSLKQCLTTVELVKLGFSNVINRNILIKWQQASGYNEFLIKHIPNICKFCHLTSDR